MKWRYLGSSVRCLTVSYLMVVLMVGSSEFHLAGVMVAKSVVWVMIIRERNTENSERVGG